MVNIIVLLRQRQGRGHRGPVGETVLEIHRYFPVSIAKYKKGLQVGGEVTFFTSLLHLQVDK